MDSLSAKQRSEETCVICNQKKYKGIHLYTSFICTECEKKIISTDTSDPQYKFYIQQLKKLNTPKIFH